MSVSCTSYHQPAVGAAVVAALRFMPLLFLVSCSNLPINMPGSVDANKQDQVQSSAETEDTGSKEEIVLPPPPAIVFEAAEAVAPRAAMLFEQSLLAIDNNELALAEVLLVELTTDFALYASPHTNLGIVYMNQGQAELAVSAFRMAIEIEPRDCRPYVQMGLLERQRFNFAAAEQAYLKCLERDENYAAAYLNLGILYELYLGRWEEALPAYERYQSLHMTPSRQVARWISVLERRAKSTNQVAAGGQ